VDYRRSLEYLYGLQQFGIKLGLENVRGLLSRLGDPQDALSVVHIAGTNGKGSTACNLAALIGSADLRVGLYTSPHLHSFTERIRIDGAVIDETEVVALTDEIRTQTSGIPVTFFEFTTALALLYFARRQVDWVVLETGLGGRLDATNVVHPRLTLLTPVALDHQAYLGSGLEQVAAEKAGIIKPGVPVVSARQSPAVERVVEQRACELNSPLLMAGRDWTVAPCGKRRVDYHGRRWKISGLPQALAGIHQGENLGLALAAAELLSEEITALEPTGFAEALRQVRWPGRLERWQGPCQVLIDGAHNPAGAQRLAEYLESIGARDLSLVASFKDDKEWLEVFARLAPFCKRCYFAPLRDQPSIDPSRVLAEARNRGLSAVLAPTVETALKGALASSGSAAGILAAGSLFLVAEAREFLLRHEDFFLDDFSEEF